MTAEAWPKDWLEPVHACLFCGSSELEPFLDGVRDWYFEAVPGEFTFSRCLRCQSLVLDNRPRPEHIAKAYAGYYTTAEHPPDDEALSVKGALRQRVRIGYARARFGASSDVIDQGIAFATRFLPARKRSIEIQYRFLPEAQDRQLQVLDYGCGNGDYLERVAEIGHEALGVDFDPDAVSLARSRGLNVIENDAIDEGAFKQRFHHITANHVLEHVDDPVRLLKRFHAWLKPGGNLFLELPNARSRGLSADGRFWRGLEAPRHFALPSKSGLDSALARSGFVDFDQIERPELEEAMANHALAIKKRFPQVSSGVGLPGDPSEGEFITAIARKGA
ncbi:class I SAM-dependent methyltransferase [Altererythrobacter lutimaris]|uniref:Class I SAM-dependent methyltransferase n=1 Tax=Altererythrobacter lutimaris TaxID=2743979 RepID=A0A850HIT7_9SPHN|nr:class I SAM-dependent methyltransferase [Altererythrobacter lutimaris]NVE95722.1 class I SAM-dependent methyltransferase [Altererythrobacter lutimaris]